MHILIYLILIFFEQFICGSFTAFKSANFINSKNAVHVVQSGRTNAHNFLPYIYGRVGQQISTRLFGLVRSDAVFSSRQFQTINSGDIFPIWPLQNIDTAIGGSGTAQQTLSVGDMLVLLGMYVRAPIQDDWQLTACFSGDFSGTFTAAGIYIIKNAYLDIKGVNKRVLIGQYINPLNIYENLPHMVSYTRGAPFAPSTVNPQVLIGYLKNKIYVQGCLYSQFLLFDNGPEFTPINDFTGFSRTYYYNSLVPIINVRLAYQTNPLEVGVSFNYKRLIPEIITRDSNLELTRNASYQAVNNYVLMAYYLYRNPYISSKAQVFYGSGTGTEYLMLGGYGVKYRDPVSFDTYFKKLPFASCWCEIEKTYPIHGVQPGIFFGITHQFGSYPSSLPMTTTNVVGDPARPPIFFSYPEIYTEQRLEVNAFLQKMWCTLISISPRAWIYFAEGFQLGLELNFYKSTFGYLDHYARTTKDRETSNSLRFLASMQYFF